MFDVSFTELMVIGVVALIVIGPERLPRVARTVGHLLGRFQRYVSTVKSDINREMHLEDLRKFEEQMKSSARNFETQMNAEVRAVEASVSTSVASETASSAVPPAPSFEGVAPQPLPLAEAAAVPVAAAGEPTKGA